MERFGEYLVHRTIGEGGMGRVYQGEERLSRRPVAIKILREKWAQLPRVRRLFINEMEILAQLEHPNIVRSLASVEVDEQLAMVLEFVDGCTLRELIDERTRLQPLEAIHVVSCVARALVAAHGHSPPVVHRDLKPDNIMVSKDGAVKVMDFGIAKVLERVDQTNTKNVGTLLYMSPEQIDATVIDHRSDLYALGLVFFELLTGRTPFCADSPRELLNLQCTQPPPRLDEHLRTTLPSSVEELLYDLLEKDPERRPASALQVLERLGDLVTTSRPPPSRSSAMKTEPMPPTEDSWHASDARAAWLARFDLTAPLAEMAQDHDTVPQPPASLARGVATTAPGEFELSTRVSVLIIAGLMVVAGLATYLLRGA